MSSKKYKSIIALLASIFLISSFGINVCASGGGTTYIQQNIDDIHPIDIIDPNSVEGQAAEISLKDQVRTNFHLLASAGSAAGLTHSSELLSHSLQDYPTDKTYSSTSTLASDINSSSSYTNIKLEILAELTNAGAFSNSVSGSGTGYLNSTTDLHLALNGFSYSWSASKGTGALSKWNVNVTITDTYDFQEKEWQNSGYFSNFSTFLNNYGASAEACGAIVPYDITVYMPAYTSN